VVERLVKSGWIEGYNRNKEERGQKKRTKKERRVIAWVRGEQEGIPKGGRRCEKKTSPIWTKRAGDREKKFAKSERADTPAHEKREYGGREK